MPEEQSLSIDETNKLRISLGLKPLQVDPVPSSSDAKGTSSATPVEEETGFDAEERRAVANWQKRQDELEKAAFRERQKEDIRKAKEAARRFAKLEGKGLGEEDEGADEGAADWVRKMKKRQKKLAKKMAEELAARDAAAEKLEYTADDIKGLKVAHDQADFHEGGDMILTLKDATIDELEEEGDELENIELHEKERLKERLEFKKKKPVYSAYDDDVDENGDRRILAQYDDEIDSKRKRKTFVLADAESSEAQQARREDVAEKLKLKPISLEIEKSEITSDYLDPSTLKIKKHKRKKMRSTRRKADDGDVLAPPPPEAAGPDTSAMELDDTPAPSTRAAKRKLEEISFIDDEDLQSLLADQRRAALRTRKILKPKDLARQLKEESPALDGTGTPIGPNEDDADEPGIVIDETTEFVSNLRAPTIPERRRRKSTSQPAVTSMADEEDEEGAAQADLEGDVDMDRSISEEPRIKRETSAPIDITSTGLEEEHTLSRGIGATLAMLNQRGLLDANEDSSKLLDLQRERERFQAEKRLKQIEAERRARMQREADRKSGIFDKMSAKEREEYARWENKQRDQQEAKEMAARFKDYKPNVQLSYKDEFGREMTQKEAFKYLSHQFHGKSSGKAKTEKRLKKIEDEKKRLAASSLQASAEGLTSSMADKAKKSKQAGVRLI